MSKKMRLLKWNSGWPAVTYRLICRWVMMKMEQFAGALKDKELVIFRERLLNEEPLTLREIGEKYDISRERVRQIEERVKRKLKAFLRKELKDVRSPSTG